MNSLLHKIVALKHVEAFRSIRFEELSVLAQAAEEVGVSAPCQIPAESVWLAISGRFQVGADDPIGPGELHTSTEALELSVLEAGQLLLFRPQQIQGLLRQHPEVALNLVAGLEAQ